MGSGSPGPVVKWKAYFPFTLLLFLQNTSWTRKLILPPPPHPPPSAGPGLGISLCSCSGPNANSGFLFLKALVWAQPRVFTLGIYTQLSSLSRLPCSGCQAMSPKLGFQASGPLPILLKQPCPLGSPAPTLGTPLGECSRFSLSLWPDIHTRQGAQ